MSKRMPDWIMAGSNAFHCARCGATRPMHLPAAIPDWILQTEAFAASHTTCQQPATTKEGVTNEN